jgi:hypothetical protein
LPDNTIESIPDKFFEVGIIKVEDQENEYVLVLELLQRILPPIALKQIILEFKEKVTSVNKGSLENNPPCKPTNSFILTDFLKAKWQWLFPLITVSASLLYLVDWVGQGSKVKASRPWL